MDIVAEIEQTTKELYKLCAYKNGLYEKVESNLERYLLNKYKGLVIKNKGLEYVFFNLRMYNYSQYNEITPSQLKATLYFNIISKINSSQKKELDEAVRDFESNNGMWFSSRKKIDLCLRLEYTFSLKQAMSNDVSLNFETK